MEKIKAYVKELLVVVILVLLFSVIVVGMLNR